MSDDDFDALYEMYRQVVDDGGALPQGGAPTRAVFTQGWIRDRAVYVARKADQTVGSYFIRPNFPAFAAHIAQSGYIVDRAARGRGIGRQLLEHSLTEARGLGYTAMMFNLVFETNPSRRLYESVGFQAVGRIPDARHGEARRGSLHLLASTMNTKNPCPAALIRLGREHPATQA